MATMDIFAPTSYPSFGMRYRFDTSWPPTTPESPLTSLQIQKSLTGADYTLSNGFINFDTRQLGANATISAASIWFVPSVINNTNAASFNVEYYDWGNDALVDGDMVLTSTPVNVASLLSSFAVDTAEEVVLTDLSGISGSSLTNFRMSLNEFGTPTGSNRITFYPPNATNEANRPRLNLTYTPADTSNAYTIQPVRIY